MAELPELDGKKPHNLQGLLKFCTELTATEDTTSPSQLNELDNEKREFLDNVISGMTLNIPKIMLECISTLLNDASTTNANEAALEELSEHLDDLNNAIDFCKLGGCPALIKHLDSPHCTLRHLSAQLIGDICQNNDILQEKILSLNALPSLLKMILTDDERLCRIRAMYAVSCIVRENEKAQNIFIEKGGFVTLLKIIEEKHEALLTKVIFLLNNLYQAKICKDAIKTQRFGENLVNLLISNAELDDTAREYASKLLVNLATDDSETKNSLKDSKGAFKQYLTNRMLHINIKTEFQEEESYIKKLLDILHKS